MVACMTKHKNAAKHFIAFISYQWPIFKHACNIQKCLANKVQTKYKLTFRLGVHQLELRAINCSCNFPNHSTYSVQMT